MEVSGTRDSNVEGVTATLLKSSLSRYSSDANGALASRALSRRGLGPSGVDVPELSRVGARHSVDEDALAHAASNDGGHGARRLVSDDRRLSGADTRGGLAADEAGLGDLVGRGLLLALAGEELAPPGLVLGGRGRGRRGGGGCC